MVNVADVEKRAEKVRSSGFLIDKTIGNVQIAGPSDIDQMALRLSRAGPGVPPHCRGENGVGMCYMLITQALEWMMPPLAVINKSYVVTNRGTERIAYESQLIHAVIERNAPLKSRLRFKIEGEGDERRCRVWGTFRGEDEPHEYISETLAKLRDARGRNEQGVLKGSPLWEAQPEVQLFYSASRTWARLYAPDVILGAYTPEDPVYEMRDVTPPSEEPALAKRLREAKAHGDRGFDLAHIRRETGRTIIEGEVNPDPANKEAKDEGGKERGGEPVDVGRGDDAGDRSSKADAEAGRPGVGGGDQPTGGDAAVEGKAPAKETPGTAAGGGKVKTKPQPQGKR